MNYNLEKNEAIQAGQKALRSLEDTKAALKTAKNFGIWDMFGGGSFVSLFKHGKISDAQRMAQIAYRDIMAFERELKDVRLDMDLNIDIGMLLTSMDFFCDNVFADFLVQNKIWEAIDKVDRAIDIVKKILSDLR